MFMIKLQLKIKDETIRLYRKKRRQSAEVKK